VPILNHFSLQAAASEPGKPPNVQIVPQALQLSGPVVQVELGIPQDLAAYYEANNIAIPSPITGRALVDTGASITAVDKPLLLRLGINPLGTANVFTPQGEDEQEMFPVKLGFVGTPLQINFNSVLGSDLTRQGIVALIGRDLLANCILVYNGVGGHFSLSLG